MKKFLLKTALYIILVLAGFEGLYRAGFLPVVTDATIFDRKMFWLQQHQARQPKFIVVGSSTALYNVRSGQMARSLPVTYYNVSAPLLNVASSWIIVKSIVRDFQPKYIMIGSNIGDFGRRTDSTYSYYADASPLVKRYCPELLYLLDYHSIHQIVYRKLKVTWLDFDPWGGGVKTYDRSLIKKRVANDPGAYLGRLSFDTVYQRVHYRALDSMSRWLREQHVQLIFVQCPIRAGNLAGASLRAQVGRHIQICDSIVEASGGIFLNLYNAVDDRDSFFFDAVHLWPAGGDIFTDSLVRDLEKIVR
ncbi:MAG TPA: hypothetical protein VFE32_08060 [Puia sp.]|jgi:hypothetical protein|nr:hypothetical protein [Puia sp.]